MNRYALALAVSLIMVASVASARWIEDKVAMPTKGVGDVNFSHYDHLEALGQDCPTCHNLIFNIDRKKNRYYTMAEMEKGKACGTCHNGKRAFGLDGDCDTCHAGDVVIKNAAIGSVTFKHSLHIDSYACDDCHSDIFQPNSNNKSVTMAQMEQGESCGTCHSGDDAFSVADDCATCHPTHDIIFKEEDMGNVLFSHEVHTDMFGCSDCHPDIFRPRTNNKPVSMEAMENGEACGACHDGGDAFSVAEDCESCHIEN